MLVTVSDEFLLTVETWPHQILFTAHYTCWRNDGKMVGVFLWICLDTLPEVQAFSSHFTLSSVLTKKTETLQRI